MVYTLHQFISDCESLGWHRTRVEPEWKAVLDLGVRENELIDVLTYQITKNIPVTMHYFEAKDGRGIDFKINDGPQNSGGSGRVTNRNDLVTYLKVSGYINTPRQTQQPLRRKKGLIF